MSGGGESVRRWREGESVEGYAEGEGRGECGPAERYGDGERERARAGSADESRAAGCAVV